MADQLGPTLRKAMLHEKIEFEASHDGLTGLPNRKSFERCVDLAVTRRNESRNFLQIEPELDDPTEFDVVMLIDLDRFKEVNDTLGHHAGDHLLIEFSNRLRAIMQPGDVLSRLAARGLVALRDGRHERDPFEREAGMAVAVDPTRALTPDQQQAFDQMAPLDHAISGLITDLDQRGMLDTTLVWVTSEFGGRNDPYTNERAAHGGMDIAAPHGKPVELRLSRS